MKFFYYILENIKSFTKLNVSILIKCYLAESLQCEKAESRLSEKIKNFFILRVVINVKKLPQNTAFKIKILKKM